MADQAISEEPVDAEVVPDDTPVSNGALVHLPQAHDVSLYRSQDPDEQVVEATKIANALKAVVDKQGLVSRIVAKDGTVREHPNVEAWQLLGSMLGVHPVPVGEPEELPWPNPVPAKLKQQHEQGLAFGFKAMYVAVKNGETVGGGQQRCTRSESHWAWRDDFQVASMAQTRAISKALNTPLKFVMVLAGYQATPAEEMPEQEPKIVELPDYAKPVDAGQRTKASNACKTICSGSTDGAKELYAGIVKACGAKQLPVAAGIALVRAAAKLELPFDPKYKDPDGDPPAAAERVPSPEALERKFVEVSEAWEGTGLTPGAAGGRVQESLRGGMSPQQVWKALLSSEAKAIALAAQQEAIR